MENTTTETSAPVKLAELSIELNVPVDKLERELSGHVFKHGGFRCVTAFRAAETLAEHDRQRAEAAAEAKKCAEEAEERRQESRQRALAERKNTEPRVARMELETVAMPGFMTAGAPPVARMMATADVDYGDGSPKTPRLSRMDWLLGGGDTGGTFGPLPGTPRKKKGS